MLLFPQFFILFLYSYWVHSEELYRVYVQRKCEARHCMGCMYKGNVRRDIVWGVYTKEM